MSIMILRVLQILESQQNRLSRLHHIGSMFCPCVSVLPSNTHCPLMDMWIQPRYTSTAVHTQPAKRKHTHKERCSNHDNTETCKHKVLRRLH